MPIHLDRRMGPCEILSGVGTREMGEKYRAVGLGLRVLKLEGSHDL